MDKKQIEEGLELAIQFNKRNGVVPTIVQDFMSGQILMLGYANQEALDRTLSTGYATFWKTSENRIWRKGEVSGDLLRIREILVDCDQDALIYKVERVGGVCHTRNPEGTRVSCFYRVITPEKRLGFID